MMEAGECPPKQIGYNLWLDIVDYFALGNIVIHGARYNGDTKGFWSLGYKLFRGKFLRFMGGYKSSGQMATNTIFGSTRSNMCGR